jgi:DNA-binding protein YbaB
MDSADETLPAEISRFTQARASGEAANGMVRLAIDGTGDLVELTIDPRAMRLPSTDLADAVREAFRTARDAMREVLRENAPAPGLDATGTALAQLGTDAQRRLTELTSIAQGLSDRVGRPD